MADQLGAAVLTLSVDDRQFSAGLQRARQTTEQSLKGINGGAAISPAISPSFSGAIGSISAGLGAASLAAAAVGAAVVGIGFAATQSAGSVQKLTAAFTGLTGSAEAAAQLRQQLFDLSKTTPFRNEEILGAAQRFLAVGVSVDALNGSINRVGTLAAQSGQSLDRLALIYAQVYAKGRLQGEENLQLLEAGVDLTQELAQVTGKSGTALQDAMSKGQVSIDDFNKALVLATGDMAALQQAGKAVDVAFNNIGDDLQQLFGGFSQAIAPALSAAFRAIDGVFQAAFPDLQSIVDFFAPLSREAERFAKTLESSPATIEVIAAGLKEIGGVVIQNIADGIAFVNDLLARVDQRKFIQGFINAELVVRRLFLAASALGAQLAKNAELSVRAVTDPVGFGKEIVAAGGFGQFIEKEYKTVEAKWNAWANSEPLDFPDLGGRALSQSGKIAGNLSSKLDGVAESAKKAADEQQKRLDTTLKYQLASLNQEGLKSQIKAANSLVNLEGTALAVVENRLAIEEAIRASKQAGLELDRELAKPKGNGDGKNGTQSDDRIDDLLIRLEDANLGVELAYANAGAKLVRNAKQAAEALKGAEGAMQNTLRSGFDFLSSNLQEQQIARAKAAIQPLVDRGVIREGIDITAPDRLFQLADFADNFNNSEKVLREALQENTAAQKELAKKQWQVYVNAPGGSASGDVVGAVNSRL